MVKTKEFKRHAVQFSCLCSSLFVLPALGVQTAFAQQKMAQQGGINGMVVDEQGEPVIGASVLVVGGSSTMGTVTDLDGNFHIKVKPGQKIKISYVGYKTMTVTAKNGLKVQMEADSQMLQGVEVVAYGTQKKVTITGAISSVKGEELTKTPVSSVSQVLAGQMTGISSIQTSGEPGSDAAQIYVRGKATFGNGDTSPLIQIDGVTMDASAMNDLDPEEIESISVLKDASATAVFGVEGANGVILVTTKRGAEGKTKISGTVSATLLTPTKLVELADSYQYALFHNMRNTNDDKVPEFSDYVINQFKTGENPMLYPNTKWTDYMMKKSTLQTKTNVNISGGTDKVKFFLSGGFYTQGGLFKSLGQSYDCGYDYKRFNYRANLDIKASKTTKISLNASGKVDNVSRPYSGGGSSSTMIKNMYYSTPFSSPGIIDGKYITTVANDYYSDDPTKNLPFTGVTALTGYYGNGFNQGGANSINLQLGLQQDLGMITKGLSFRVKGAYNTTFSTTKTGAASVAVYTPLISEGQVVFRKSGEDTTPSYSISSGKSRNWYMEAGIDWKRSFGLHNVSALVLYNQKAKYYPSSYSDIPHKVLGMVGRATYDWNNRYMAEFNIGYNGSENFAPSRRFGTFPAGSVGWVVSEEKFWKPLKKVVDFLKLRASVGLVGNENIGGGRFLYTPDSYEVLNSGVYARDGWGYVFGIDNNAVLHGARELARHNQDVGWEKALKQDYGFDISFLDGKLRGNFDYYKEHRTDIFLQDATAPGLLGFSVPYANLGVADNWGWEVAVNWCDKIGKDFRYNVGFNISYNQNKIVENKEVPREYDYQMAKGKRIGSRKLYQFWKFYYEGAREDYEKEFGSPFPTQLAETAGGELKPGDCVYIDLNGDNVINSDDMKYASGYTDDPEYTMGINMGFNWKKLSFSMQWTGAWNVSRMLQGVYRQPFYANTDSEHGGLLQYMVDNAWTIDNPSQSAKYPRATSVNVTNNYANASLYEVDSKYLRLKTVQIAYDFKFPFMKKLGLTNLQASLSAYNLLTLSPYCKFGDPETSGRGDAPSYPLQRTYTLTLKLGF